MFGLLIAVILSAELDPVEANLLKYTNETRVAAGLHPLEIDEELQQGCRHHAAWMANHRSMTHASGWRENIAMGQTSSHEAIRTWYNSSGHRATMLARNATKVGIAGYRVNGGAIYWCMRVK